VGIVRAGSQEKVLVNQLKYFAAKNRKLRKGSREDSRLKGHYGKKKERTYNQAKNFSREEDQTEERLLVLTAIRKKKRRGEKTSKKSG